MVKIKKRVLLYSGIMERYFSVTFDDIYLDADVKNFLLDYINNIDSNYADGKGLFICDSDNDRRISIFSCIIKVFLLSRKKCKLCGLSGLLDFYCIGWNDYEVKDEFNFIKNIDVLAIDKIDKCLRGKMDLAEDFLERLLNYRYTRNKIVFLGSEIPLENIGFSRRNIEDLIKKLCCNLEL